jgi:tetratricopeptide (TPR) repeat protein
MRQATIVETLERQHDSERFAAAHEQIQARLDALADESTRSALARTELESQLTAAIEKAEATAAALAATQDNLATVTAERDRLGLARMELEARLAVASETAEAAAATLARTQDSLALIAAERDRLADQSRRWFEAAVLLPSQADPAHRHTGSALSLIRRRNLLQNARNAAARHRPEMAARYYGELLNADPRRPALWVQFGNNLKDVGKLPEAERAYRRALEYQEDSADALLQLGYVLALQDRLPEAAASLMRSLALAPESEPARAALRTLGWTESEIAASTAKTARPVKQQPQRSQGLPRLPVVGNRWRGIFRR